MQTINNMDECRKIDTMKKTPTNKLTIEFEIMSKWKKDICKIVCFKHRDILGSTIIDWKIDVSSYVIHVMRLLNKQCH